MNKKILLVAIIIILIGGVILGICLFKDETNNVVGEFKLSDFQNDINRHSLDKMVEKINNAEEAKVQAEKLWIENFGRFVKREKPYNVSYDSANKVWLVYGSLPGKLGEYFGGVAYILIQTDGKVLAIWHGK